LGTLVEIIEWVNLALFTVVALVALREWRSGRGKAGIWAALTFGALALVADVAQLIPDAPRGAAGEVAFRLIIAVLVLFPYLLYRFTTAFREATRRLERLLGLMTLALVLWTFLLPEFPAEGEAGTTAFTAYLIAFLVHWTVLSVVVAARLWRAGSRQPSVARRRMRMLTFASLAITLALIVSAVGGDDGSIADLVAGLLTSASAVAFLLGLAPPPALRLLWRSPEQEQLQSAIARLMAVTTEQGIADEVLPPTARIVSARGVALRGSDGRLIATYGIDAERGERLAAGWDAADEDVVRIEIPSGELLVWTTPYAPFFGTEELRLLRTLGALTGLALDRARLFAQERNARTALERADEVKTNFIALAAHELRTPVTSVVGFAETLVRREHELPEGVREELKQGLLQQSQRMRNLVEQLLDLSRLDAEAVEIRPEPLEVLSRVEEIVAAAAGDRADDVRIAVPAELEATVDPAAFDRIVSNLVVNALRYGAPPVLVGAEHRDRHFRVSVEDRGSGVPPDFVPQLFERFARSEATRSQAVGSGLGLAIAASYAKAHGGDLLYEPAAPHGARFELVLPAGSTS
jgi:signal transduction histidine kinase